MNLLADENISHDLVNILRSEGHSIQTVADIGMLGASDQELLRYATFHNLTILTEDKDFGYWLEFSTPESSARAILLRFNIIDLETIAKQLLTAFHRIESEVPTGRMMAVLSHGKLRIREWKK